VCVHLLKGEGIEVTRRPYSHRAKLLIGVTSLDIRSFFCNVDQQVACEDRVSSPMIALVRRNMWEHLTRHHNKVIILMHL
jgi:hypothetical protein